MPYNKLNNATKFVHVFECTYNTFICVNASLHQHIGDTFSMALYKTTLDQCKRN